MAKEPNLDPPRGGSGLPLVLPHSPLVVIRGTGPRQAPPKHDFGGKPPARNAFAVTHPFLAKSNHDRHCKH